MTSRIGPMPKKLPSLAELAETMDRFAPNPFVIACMEAVVKTEPIVTAVPPLEKVGLQAAVKTAVVMLQGEPTHDNLVALRNAIEDYELGGFEN